MNYEDAIKELLDTNLSYTEISRRLGITRNAVAGHIFRIRKAEGTKAVMRKPLGITKSTRVSSSTMEIPAGVTGKHLLELQEKDCRFPVGRDNGHHFFCGEPRRDSRTRYCEIHHPIVWHKARRAEATPEAKKKSRFELKRLGA